MSDLLDQIGFDKLTPEEIQELDSYKQLCLLTEVGQEIARLTSVECDAVDAKFEAKCLLIDNPSKENKKNYEKALKIHAKIKAWIAARKTQHSGLQTNLKHN